MQIGELKVRLGVDADTFKVKDFARALGEIPFSVAAGITALTGMSFALGDLIKDTLGLANNLSLFRAQTGLSAIELERWTGVAKQMGLNGDVVQSSVMGIAKAIAQLKLGVMDESFLVAMGRMGISLKGKTPFQILQEMGTRTRGMDPNLASSLLTSAHVDPAMMKIFELSQGQFEKMAGKGVILDDEGIKAMQQFQVALSSFEMEITKSFTPALVAATPIMGQLADSLSDLVKTLGPSLFRGVARGVGNVAAIGDLWRNGSVEGFEHIVENFVKGVSYLPPDYRKNPFEANITNNIHSTADPEEVARQVAEHSGHSLKNAMKQFNNGGR